MAELESEPRQIVPRSSEFNYYTVPSLKKKEKKIIIKQRIKSGLIQ